MRWQQKSNAKMKFTVVNKFKKIFQINSLIYISRNEKEEQTKPKQEVTRLEQK